MLEVARFGPVTRLRMARRIPGFRPLYVHAFLVDGCLIDAGTAHTARELLRVLAGETVEQLVLTHHHEDHVGAAAWLGAERGLVPRIHPAGLPALGDPPRLPYYERLYWGRPRPAAGKPLGEVVATRRYRFQVLHTPGHAPDHVVLYEAREGWLFTGDLLIHPRLPTLRRTEDLRSWRASLEAVAGLPARQVFCGHYPKVTGPEVLRAKLQFWTDAAAQAAALRREGLSARAIRDRLLGPEGWLAAFTAGQFSKLNLVQALLALDGAAEE